MSLYKKNFLQLVSFSKNKASKLRPKLLATIGGLVLTGIFAILLISVNQEDKVLVNCSELSSRTEKKLEKASNKDEVMQVHSDLASNTASCDRKNGFLNIGSKTDDKLSQLRFFHDKAVTGYRLGKYDEAKEDALKGLKLNTELSEADGTLENHESVIKELEYVRDGTY